MTTSDDDETAFSVFFFKKQTLWMHLLRMNNIFSELSEFSKAATNFNLKAVSTNLFLFSML